MYSQRVIEIIDQLHHVQPGLAISADGWPDHRPTFLWVQLSWIALFKKLDLDLLIAAQTATGQRYVPFKSSFL